MVPNKTNVTNVIQSRELRSFCELVEVKENVLHDNTVAERITYEDSNRASEVSVVLEVDMTQLNGHLFAPSLSIWRAWFSFNYPCHLIFFRQITSRNP